MPLVQLIEGHALGVECVKRFGLYPVASQGIRSVHRRLAMVVTILNGRGVETGRGTQP